jgi:hypothetical protein
MRGPALVIGLLGLAGCVSLPDVPPPVAAQDGDPGYPALIPLDDLEFDAAREDAEALRTEQTVAARVASLQARAARLRSMDIN